MMQLYSGDLLPNEAWEMLKGNSEAHLIDVRTSAEWHYVGIPMLNTLGKELVMLEWRLLPDMVKDNTFAQRLTKALPDKNPTLIFLCRTGGRSQEAAIAMSVQGYKHCYNIINGFEGELDKNGHRGNVSGWKASKLPWRQD